MNGGGKAGAGQNLLEGRRENQIDGFSPSITDTYVPVCVAHLSCKRRIAILKCAISKFIQLHCASSAVPTPRAGPPVCQRHGRAIPLAQQRCRRVRRTAHPHHRVGCGSRPTQYQQLVHISGHLIFPKVKARNNVNREDLSTMHCLTNTVAYEPYIARTLRQAQLLQHVQRRVRCGLARNKLPADADMESRSHDVRVRLKVPMQLVDRGTRVARDDGARYVVAFEQTQDFHSAGLQGELCAPLLLQRVNRGEGPPRGPWGACGSATTATATTSPHANKGTAERARPTG